MSSIKFSFSFPKLFGEDGYPISRARLLEVLEVELSDLSDQFINYDTAHGAHILPFKGAYLMLIFQKPGSIHLFTTLRRSTPEKLKYYRSLRGETLTVEVAPAAVAV